MEEKRIIEFKTGDEIQGFYLIKALNVKTSSNNKMYLDITLSDVTGEVNGKVWDVKGNVDEMFAAGDIVKVRGSVTLWQNQTQLKIIKIRKTEETDEINVEDYVPAAPIDPETMMDEFMTYIDKIENEDVKKLVSHIVKMYEEQLIYYPAAKSNHHSIRSGLLYHVLRMLRTGDALSNIYLNVNRDLLFAGIILHDIEKINEMSANELGIVSEYTKEGQLLGHIIQGIKRIDQVSKELGIDEDISLMIQHLILSHHYEPEFGSPKKPMTPEGELLHYIDMIDARMYDMDKVYQSMESDSFSDPIFVLDRRRMFKSNFHE